ncbi:MAG: hypothetical protein RIG62_19625 [Cyclobacteriaceae bacterium]|jgi:hypothetical protein
MKKIGRRCAFCHEEKRLTKEHIWPKCIVKKMPELELKYLDSRNIITSSELVISDVCSECNNEKLSLLDSYFCSLYDSYFKDFVEEKKPLKFTYNYDLLLRSFLKITYNSSRTVSRENNDLERFRNYILSGNEIREDVIVKIDIITPSIINDVKIYPSAARCGTFSIGKKSDNFILRVLSVNSYYFYIVISNEEKIAEDIMTNEFWDVFNSVPGTLIQPYGNEITVNKFSREDSYSILYPHISSKEEYYAKIFNNKNS